MLAWLRSLWTDEARFGAAATIFIGSVGTVLTGGTMIEELPRWAGFLGLLCNAIAMRVGYTTPGGRP